MTNLPTMYPVKPRDPEFAALHARIDEVLLEIMKLRSDLAMTFSDEHSTTRQEMSKRLGDKLIERLKAEDLARKRTTGES